MPREHLQADSPGTEPRPLPEGFILAALFFGAFVLAGLLVALTLGQTSVLTGALAGAAVVLPAVWFLTPDER